jgi:hypothetical protein
MESGSGDDTLLLAIRLDPWYYPPWDAGLFVKYDVHIPSEFLEIRTPDHGIMSTQDSSDRL